MKKQNENKIGMGKLFIIILVGFSLIGGINDDETTTEQPTTTTIEDVQPQEVEQPQEEEQPQEVETVSAEQRQERLNNATINIDSLIKSAFNMDSATTETTNNGNDIIVNIKVEGVANDLSVIAFTQDFSEWETIVDNIESTCFDYKKMTDVIVGDNQSNVIINVLNDENDENAFLIVLNGTTIYNVEDEIRTN